MALARVVTLRSRPVGAPTEDNFSLVTQDLGEPGENEVQVRNLWMSVDPYMRGRMNAEKSYIEPFEIGQPLTGHAIGEVVRSNSTALKPGDIVSSMFGWRDAFNASAKELRSIDARGLPLQTFLGAAGAVGLTAYVGLTKIAGVKTGETVLISAAAGAVGSAACQIAKIKGARVIGIAGGQDKIAFLEEIGVDCAVDYKKEPDLVAALARVAPEGVDVYFDNVGGAHLEAALAVANNFARFPICGMISQYNVSDRPLVPANLFQIVVKSIRMEGFILSNHFGSMSPYLSEFSQWHRDGRFRWRETVVEGIDNAVRAFLELFAGNNIGKMLVKLG